MQKKWIIIGMLKKEPNTVVGYIETDGEQIQCVSLTQVLQGVKTGRYDTEAVKVNGRKLTFTGIDDEKIPCYQISQTGQIQRIRNTRTITYSIVSLVMRRGELYGVRIFLEGQVRFIEMKDQTQLHIFQKYDCFNARVTTQDGVVQIASKKGSLPEFDYDELIKSRRSKRDAGIMYVSNAKEVSGTGAYAGVKVEILPNGDFTDSAFQGSGIERVHIAKGVRMIPPHSFSYCEALREVELEEGLKQIGQEAFYKAENLRGIKLPQSVIHIGKGAFKQAENLGEVSLGAVQQIEAEAFCETAIKEIVFPPTLLAIKESAFQSCKKLKTVQIPKTVTFLGNAVFRNCEGLEDITVGGGVGQIPAEMADHCTSLYKVRVAKEIRSIGEGAFCNCNKLQEVNIEKGSTLYSIGSRAFRNTGIQEITIPSGVRTLQDEAWSGCKHLQKVELPRGLVSIGEACFRNTGIKEIEIPNTVMTLKGRVFEGCRALTRVKLPKTLRIIPLAMFKDSGLQKIEFPKTIGEIADFAFGCSGVTTIKIPEGVSYIGYGCFSGCQKLTSIEMADTVIDVGGRVFANCNTLKEVKLSGSLRKLSSELFYGCCALEKIRIPQEVREIWSKVFCGCVALKRIELPENIETICADAFEGVNKNLQIICKQDSKTAQRMRSLGFTDIKEE